MAFRVLSHFLFVLKGDISIGFSDGYVCIAKDAFLFSLAYLLNDNARRKRKKSECERKRARPAFFGSFFFVCFWVIIIVVYVHNKGTHSFFFYSRLWFRVEAAMWHLTRFLKYSFSVLSFFFFKCEAEQLSLWCCVLSLSLFDFKLWKCCCRVRKPKNVRLRFSTQWRWTLLISRKRA